MKSQIRTSDCEGWSYFLAGRREGRPEKNRISIKQIMDVLSKIYPDTRRRNADALLIGGVAAVRNHFHMFSLYTILDERSHFTFCWQPSVLTNFLLFSGLGVIFIVYGNVRIYCLVASVAECKRGLRQGEMRNIYILASSQSWSLIGWRGPSLVSHWSQLSYINPGVQQNKSLFFSLECWSNLGMAPVSSVEPNVTSDSGDNYTTSVYHCHAGDQLTTFLGF